MCPNLTTSAVRLMILYSKLTCQNWNVINQTAGSVGKLIHKSFYYKM